MDIEEPKRETKLVLLVPYFRNRVIALLDRMKARGFDPVVFETRRSKKRQQYLYWIGRRIQKNRKPVTWTMNSRHNVGKAVDIISGEYGWNDKAFFDALAEEANIQGLHVISTERCHVQWEG